MRLKVFRSYLEDCMDEGYSDSLLCFLDEDGEEHCVSEIYEDNDGDIILSIGNINSYDIETIYDILEDYSSKAMVYVALDDTDYEINGRHFVDKDEDICFRIYADAPPSDENSVAEKKEILNNSEYEKHFSEDGLNQTLSKLSYRLGVKTVYMILWLYYAMKEATLSVKNKAIIIGALGYLISPIDLINDLIPFLGLTDDIAVITAAFAALTKIISSADSTKVAKKAKEQLRTIFPNFSDSDIN